MSTQTQTTLTRLIEEQAPSILEAAASAQTPAAHVTSATVLAAAIDHTLLKPDATVAQIRQLCDEAATYGFASVCVNPTWVPTCAELLAAAESVVCTVIGFPLGATFTAAKVAEANAAIAAGAQELDMVINIGRLKDGDYLAVYEDIAAVVETAHTQHVRGKPVLVKVIIETCLLTDAEKVAASLLTKAAGADFVKTSTGFSTGGATIADVQLMRLAVGPELGLKAAGGVRTAADAFEMFAVGATRIGASAGVKIIQSVAESPQGANAVADRESEGKTTY